MDNQTSAQRNALSLSQTMSPTHQFDISRGALWNLPFTVAQLVALHAYSPVGREVDCRFFISICLVELWPNRAIAGATNDGPGLMFSTYGSPIQLFCAINTDIPEPVCGKKSQQMKSRKY